MTNVGTDGGAQSRASGADDGAQTQPSEADFEQLVETASKFQHNGQEGRALELAWRAEAIAPRIAGVASPEVARAHNSLGVVFFQAGYFRAALLGYQRALDVANKLEGGKEDLAASVNNNLGQVYQRLGQLELAQNSPRNRSISPQGGGKRDQGPGFFLGQLGERRCGAR